MEDLVFKGMIIIMPLIAKQKTNFSCFHSNLVWTRSLILFAQEGSMVGWLDDLAEKSIGHSCR
jgi:hypothetical protein